MSVDTCSRCGRPVPDNKPGGEHTALCAEYLKRTAEAEVAKLKERIAFLEGQLAGARAGAAEARKVIAGEANRFLDLFETRLREAGIPVKT